MEPTNRFENDDIWVDQIKSGELKEAINLFIWRWGYSKMTLAQSESIAVAIFDMLVEWERSSQAVFTGRIEP